MKLSFGLHTRRALTGAELYVRILQVMLLLPLPYIMALAGYPSVITTYNALTALFEVGMMAIPRALAVGLSVIYRSTTNEILVYFVLAVCALVAGVVLGRLLKQSDAQQLTVRRVLVALIAADLVLRVLPFGFNLAFGLVPAVVGWVCRAVCLALVVCDVRAV